MGSITVANMNLSAFNVFTDESETFVTPEKDYEFVEIPGLNGRLTIDNHRLKDITLPVNCFIRKNFATNYTNLMNFLLGLDGYAPIELSNDPNHVRYGLFYNSVKPDTGSFNKSGRFTLNFNCRPERYIANIQPINVTYSDYDIYGYNDFDAKPIIQFNGNGWFKIESGDEQFGTFRSFTINVAGRESDPDSAKHGVIINTEQMTCYNLDYTNASNDVVLQNGYPVLTGGKNTVTYSSSSSQTNKLIIQPRWWEI